MDVSKIQIGSQVCSFNDADLQAKVQNHIQTSSAVQKSLVEDNATLKQNMKQLIGTGRWQMNGSRLQQYITDNQSNGSLAATTFSMSTSTSERRHIAISCSNCKKFELIGGQSATYYTFAKTYTPPTSNVSIDFATGCSRLSLDAGAAKSGDVPSDANFLIVQTMYSGDTSGCPSSISLTAGDCIMNDIVERISDVQEEIETSSAVQDTLIESNAWLKQNIEQLLGQGRWSKKGTKLQQYITNNQKDGALAATTFALSIKTDTTSQRRHIAISCSNCESFQITGGQKSTYYTFAKTYTVPTSNSNIDFATGCSRFSLKEDTTVSGDIPSDANYMIVQTKYSKDQSCSPSSISIIAGNCIINNIVDRIEDIQEDVDELNETQDKLIENDADLIGSRWSKKGTKLTQYITDNQKDGTLAATTFVMSTKGENPNIRRHIAINCSGCETFEITGGAKSTYYTFTKTYTPPIGGQSIDFATGCSRFSLSAKTTVSGDVPSDANYLIVQTMYSGDSTCSPSSIVISDEDCIISEIEQRISDVQESIQGCSLQKFEWIALGDSITAGTYSFPSILDDVTQKTATDASKGWVCKAANILKWNVKNEGIGGMGWLKADTQGRNMRGYTLADEIAKRTDEHGEVEGFKPYDLVTLAYGINDWKSNMEVGYLNDEYSFDKTPTTVIEAMRKTIETVYRSNPKIKIIVVTPLNCAGYSSDKKKPYYAYKDADNFALGYRYQKSGTLQEFVQNIISVCNYYGIQYIDQTHYSCFNRLNIINKTIGSETITGMSYDGIHPTEEGHTCIAKQMAKKLVSCSNGDAYLQTKVFSLQSAIIGDKKLIFNSDGTVTWSNA